MNFNTENFQNFINEHWEEHMIDMTDSISTYIPNYCPVTPNILNAILAAAKESYFASIKTIELAIISSFQD